MAQITFKGNAIQTAGSLPAVGSKAPEFELINTKLAAVKLSDFKGSKVVLNIFPSVDTGICAASVRAFNQSAAALENTKIICISKDLPFAFARFCAAEGIENLETLSDFKRTSFDQDYGLTMVEGPLAGLLSRAVLVLDAEGTVVYAEQVPEIGQEPNYEAALKAL
ncbi:MAG: thiol peroxidase [Flavobacterium sp.]|nr:thiol peroxidase [Candidatus Neoflavobacterium equi]